MKYWISKLEYIGIKELQYMQNKQDLDLSCCSNLGEVFSLFRSAAGCLIRPTDKKVRE